MQALSCEYDMLQPPKFSVGDVSKFRAATEKTAGILQKEAKEKKMIR